MNKLKELFPHGWYNLLEDTLVGKPFKNIGNELLRLSNEGVKITPTFNDTFRAFQECPLNKLNSIIIGMDPYPGRVGGKYVADGIAFSSRDSINRP